MDRLLAGRRRRRAALSRRRPARRPGDHDDRHRGQAGAPRGGGWSVGGMAKGAGMLAPALATMLVVVTTDAVAEPAVLDPALRAATRTTFDRVDSDGCMSTNDTVLLLASGASRGHGRPRPRSPRRSRPSAPTSPAGSSPTPRAPRTRSPSRSSAPRRGDAVEVARAVSRSNLFKCAVFGQDPNWGRVLAAVGTTPPPSTPTPWTWR